MENPLESIKETTMETKSSTFRIGMRIRAENCWKFAGNMDMTSLFPSLAPFATLKCISFLTNLIFL